MVRAEAEKAIIDIYSYFRFQTIPSESQFDQWYEKIKFIPGEAVDWIVVKITDMDSLPRNLPKTIVALWYAYRKEHPEKIANVNTECDECNSTGFIHYVRLSKMYDLPMKIHGTALCPKCENYRKTVGQHLISGGITESGVKVMPTLRLTKQDVLDRGWELEYQDYSDLITTSGKVENLTQGMLKDVKNGKN